MMLLLNPNYLYSTLSLLPHLHSLSSVSRTAAFHIALNSNFNCYRLLFINLISNISAASPSTSQSNFLASSPPYSFKHSNGSNSKFVNTGFSSTLWRNNSELMISGMSLLRTHSNSRLLSTSVSLGTPSEKKGFQSVSPNKNRKLNAGCKELMPFVSTDKIVDIIRSNEKNMESQLDSLCGDVRKITIVEAFGGLNRCGLPAFRFFCWICDKHPTLYRDYDICSLMIDNCWRLGDYENMLCLLEDFRTRKICLTGKAFGFIAIFGSTKVLMEETVQKVVKILDAVGGSCRHSGIHSLIKLLCCDWDLFDMAKLAIESTKRQVSYYNLLVRGKCLRGLVKDAQYILDEMREVGCDPDVRTYNYLIGGLCKHRGSTSEACNVFDEMIKRGCCPDALTFEILIYYSCVLGDFDSAIGFYDQMVSRGIEPRFSTHAAFVKGYFNSHHYHESYNYVAESSMKPNWQANRLYSLLAGLYQKQGDLVASRKILVEMMEKGLKPNFSVYMRVLKSLRKTGSIDLARNLQGTFCSLNQSCSMGMG
ncbi:hypothetical protein Ancab_012567 [Ancistrocladus abbreviatus]